MKFAEGPVLLEVEFVKKTLNCVGVGEAVVIVDVEVNSSVEVALTVLMVWDTQISLGQSALQQVDYSHWSSR